MNMWLSSGSSRQFQQSQVGKTKQDMLWFSLMFDYFLSVLSSHLLPFCWRIIIFFASESCPLPSTGLKHFTWSKTVASRMNRITNVSFQKENRMDGFVPFQSDENSLSCWWRAKKASFFERNSWSRNSWVSCMAALLRLSFLFVIHRLQCFRTQGNSESSRFCDVSHSSTVNSFRTKMLITKTPNNYSPSKKFDSSIVDSFLDFMPFAALKMKCFANKVKSRTTALTEWAPWGAS